METQLSDESSLDEAEQAQMMVDNPLAFERAEIAKHVEINRRGGDEEAQFSRT
jgi:hypothetical protein